ncbi:uncharacterized protein LOC134472078 isoform X4 [Cavia porcellus]|uniref:uncharacterized protein LOC134472078 isoform X4 n=1 Tax=Cavia porcellus TaxID=10141 RepID=UPI002FE06C2F
MAGCACHRQDLGELSRRLVARVRPHSALCAQSPRHPTRAPASHQAAQPASRVPRTAQEDFATELNRHYHRVPRHAVPPFQGFQGHSERRRPRRSRKRAEVSFGFGQQRAAESRASGGLVRGEAGLATQTQRRDAGLAETRQGAPTDTGNSGHPRAGPFRGCKDCGHRPCLPHVFPSEAARDPIPAQPPGLKPHGKSTTELRKSSHTHSR